MEDPKEPDPPGHFRRFMDLPFEVREFIWQYAIAPRSATPRLYRYFLCEEEGEFELPHTTNSQGSAVLENSYLWGTYCQDSYQRPWADKLTSYTAQELPHDKENYFRYLYDDGLSLACRESRAIVLKDMKEHAENNNPKPKKAHNVTHTGKTMQLNVGSVIKLEFSPFYLKPHGNQPWKEFASNISFLRQPQLKQIDIAFDFDSRQELWTRFYQHAKLGESCKEIPDHSIRGVVVRAVRAWVIGELPEEMRIFLIDRKNTAPLIKQPNYLDWEYRHMLGTVVLADEEYDYVAAVGYWTDRFLRMVKNSLELSGGQGQFCLMPVIPVRKGEELVSADVAANWRRS
jgi:hypothetical protein